MKTRVILILFLALLNLPNATFAVEIAPRISDREIIEKLARLEIGQAALRSEMKAGQDSLRSEMKAGQAALRSEMKAGQAALRSEMKAGQAALGKRMDDMNQQMSNLFNVILSLFGAMMGLIFGLFIYISKLLKPVTEKINLLETEVMRDLDMSHSDGSLLSRLVKAMRELARDDDKIASVLRSYSLL